MQGTRLMVGDFWYESFRHLTVAPLGRTGQHAFTGAKNFAVESANFKSAGRNLTIYENCNIVTSPGGPQGPPGLAIPAMEIDEIRAKEGKIVGFHPPLLNSNSSQIPSSTDGESII